MEETESKEDASSWSDAFAKAKSSARAYRRKTPAKPEKNAEVSAEYKQLQEVADQLSKPEYWKALVRAPADIMLAKTGHAHWNLPDRQVDTLAVTGSLAVKAWVDIDPRYLSLILFLANASFIYGTAFMEELRLQKQEALEKSERRPLVGQ